MRLLKNFERIVEFKTSHYYKHKNGKDAFFMVIKVMRVIPRAGTQLRVAWCVQTPHNHARPLGEMETVYVDEKEYDNYYLFDGYIRGPMNPDYY